MTIELRGIVAAVACAGALASASLAYAETDWDSLKSADWGGAAGNQAGEQATDESSRIAEADASGDGDVGAAIQAAFVDLGMATPRAECYGRMLVQNLSPEHQQEAVALIRQSDDADDVKMNVLSGGPAMVGGFSAADGACPEGAGG